MVANSSNLIITVKPANQRTLTAPRRGSISHASQLSSESAQSQNTVGSDEDHDQDEIVDLTGIPLEEEQDQQTGAASSTSITTTTTDTLHL